MIKRHKYRAYPNKEQHQYFQKTFGCCRFVYNWALALKNQSYLQEKESGVEKPKGLSSAEISKKLTLLKKEEQYLWLNEVPSVALNWSLQHLDVAFQNFFRRLKQGGEPGFPKFKSKHDSFKSFSYHQGYKIDLFKQIITVPKSGNLKFIAHRHFKGDYKTVTVIQEPSGKYYISVVVDDKKPASKLIDLNPKKVVGVDVGVINSLTLSDGHQIQMDLEFQKLEKRLLKLQRNLSRKTLKSKNFDKAKNKVALIHEKIRFKRKYAIENCCVELVDYMLQQGHTGLAIRKYDIKSMVDTKDIKKDKECKTKNGARYVKRKVNKKILGGAMGMLCTQIKQKVSESGLNIIEFSANEIKTTAKCFNCKSEKISINLKTRILCCKDCGYQSDIDINASKNIEEYSLLQFAI